MTPALLTIEAPNAVQESFAAASDESAAMLLQGHSAVTKPYASGGRVKAISYQCG